MRSESRTDEHLGLWTMMADRRSAWRAWRRRSDAGGAVADDPSNLVAQLLDHARDASSLSASLSRVCEAAAAERVNALVADQGLRKLGDPWHDV